MPQENVNQEFRLRKIDKITNYLNKEINRSELRSKNHIKVCRVLNYIDNSTYCSFWNYWMCFHI